VSKASIRDERSAVRSGSDVEVKREESCWRYGSMFERRSGGRLTDGDSVARLARVASANRVIFSFNDERSISVMGGITSYFLRIRRLPVSDTLK